MTDRLTKFNEETGEYEYKDRAKTQEEFNAQRKAVIQRLGEFEDRAEDVKSVRADTVRKGKCHYCPFFDRCDVSDKDNRHIVCAEIERSENGT